MTNRAAITMLLATLALAGARSGRAGEEPERPFDLSAHVPADAVVYLTLDDLGEAWRRFPKTPLGRILAEPEIEKLFEKISARTGAGKASVSLQGIGLPMKIGLRDGETMPIPGRISVAVLPPGKGPGTEVGVLGAMSLGTDREKVAGILNGLIGQLQQVDPAACPQSIRLLDGKIQSFCLYDVRLEYLWLGDTIVVGTRRADLERVLASTTGQPAPTLSQSPRFRDLVRRTGAAAGGAFAYVDPRMFLDRMEPGAETEILRAFGLGSIEAVGLGSRTAGDGSAETRIRVALADEGRGFLDAIVTRSGDLASLAYMPERAAVAGALRIDPERLVPATIRLVEASSPKGTPREAVEGSWLVELARSAGSEIAIYVASPRYGGLAVESGIVVLLRDPERASRALVAAREDLKARVLNVRGRSFLKLDPSSSGIWSAITVSEGALVLASSVNTADAMIRRAKVQRVGVVRSARSARLFAQPAASCGVLDVDTPGLFRWAYRTVGPMIVWGINLGTAKQEPRPASPISWADFPDADTITRHLSPGVTWLWSDERGIGAHTRSSVQGEIPVFTVAMGTGLGLFLARVEEEPARAPSTWDRRRQVAGRDGGTKEEIEDRKRRHRDHMRAGACKTNLTLFRYQHRKYRASHAGESPPSLAAFFGQGPSYGTVFICPADVEGWLAWKKGEKTRSSYAYFGPDRPDRVAHPERFPVVWDAQPWHEGRRMVLFLDGRIDPVPEERFQKMLSEARELTAK